VSEVIEVAAIPIGPSSPLATTIETEAASLRIEERNKAGNSSGIAGYASVMGSGSQPY
jgi:hypothetical protein